MKRSLFSLWGTALGLLFFAAANAQASFVAYNYSWAPNSLVVAADSGGTGGISMTLQQDQRAEGSSDVIATNLRTFSSAPRTTPDQVARGSYSLTLTLTDVASGASGQVRFDGFFSGTFSTTSSNVANTFTGDTSRTIVLGGHRYVVTIGPYAPPGPPSASNAGTISAHIAVDEDGQQGGDTPEPSTLLLSCMGISFLGAASWRKWKQKK
jgi:hypothetical protein